MRFTVGGKEYDLTKDRVISAMRGVPSERIQKHIVEIDGETFPPKQAFATVTGRARSSFTTNEAQRVLRRLGFVCRTASQVGGIPMWVAQREDDGESSADERIAAIQATLATIEAAVAGLHARVKQLEDVS